MTALVVALLFAVALLGVLVAGLLRSHADILRALHDLGAGLGDPGASPAAEASLIQIGPKLPAERMATAAPDIAGTSPAGDGVAVTMQAAPRTLLAFLSTGCSTCSHFWEAFQAPETLGLPAGMRPVIVVKGPDAETPSLVRALAPGRVDVVCSTAAWIDYEVPGSPFFVVADDAGRRVGEGLANTIDQVVALVTLAERERSGGAAREAENDAALLAAGIRPGDPSLYPGQVAR